MSSVSVRPTLSQRVCCAQPPWSVIVCNCACEAGRCLPLTRSCARSQLPASRPPRTHSVLPEIRAPHLCPCRCAWWPCQTLALGLADTLEGQHPGRARTVHADLDPAAAVAAPVSRLSALAISSDVLLAACIIWMVCACRWCARRRVHSLQARPGFHGASMCSFSLFFTGTHFAI